MKLTNQQKRKLRSLSNSLNPIIQVGKEGVSENLFYTIEQALKAHELIKVHVHNTSPMDLKTIEDLIVAKTDCHLVQIVGFNLTLYRPSEKAKIVL